MWRHCTVSKHINKYTADSLLYQQKMHFSLRMDFDFECSVKYQTVISLSNTKRFLQKKMYFNCWMLWTQILNNVPLNSDRRHLTFIQILFQN